MKGNIFRIFSYLVGTALLLGVQHSFAEDTKLGGHEIQTKLRLIHFDRDFEDDEDDRDQTGLGLEVNYKSPQLWDIVGLGLSGYVVEDISDGGDVREDVLTLDDGELDGFALLGQAYLNFTPTDNFSIKLGRMKHKSMFLNSSSSRAVPNTFQGVSAKFNATDNLSLHASIYDKWSRRARDNFEGFSTDQSEQGDIDYVGVIGAKYKVNDNFKLEAEYLESKDFLNKFGVRGTYLQELSSSSLTYTLGVFTSSDDGDLFVTRSESGDLDDEDVPGSEAGVTESENDGLGGYLDITWKKDNLKLSAAIAKIDEIWLEDNFSGDHGRNPFPTRSTVGPDLTNTNETAYRLKLDYDWKEYIPGLKTSFAIGFGEDAENSVDSSLGTADEDWREVRIDYKIPALKGLKFRGIWHDYNSDETGSVDGVKQDETDIRLYLDYVYTFK